MCVKETIMISSSNTNVLKIEQFAIIKILCVHQSNLKKCLRKIQNDPIESCTAVFNIETNNESDRPICAG